MPSPTAKPSKSFVESILLLVATAALSGLLVPVVMGHINETRLKEQKRFEADLARQTKIIDAQAQSFETIAGLLIAFQLAGLKVSYDKIHGPPETYTQSFAEYDEKAWDYFSTLRAEIGKARRLVSRPMYEKLLSFYEGALIKLDASLVSLHEQGERASADDWTAHHEFRGVVAQKADDLLEAFARELRLAVRAPGEPG